MNVTIITGNLTQDPEIRSTQNGGICANFTVASQRQFKDKNTGKREADFIRCVAYKQQAEFINNYCGKGHKVGIVGTIQTRSYDAQDGSKRFVTEVVVNNVESLQSKSQSENAAPQQSAAASFAAAAAMFPEAEITDDELPFR